VSAIVMVACIGLVLTAGQIFVHRSTTPAASPSATSKWADASVEGYAFGWGQRLGTATVSADAIDATCVSMWKLATTNNYRPEWHWDRQHFVAGCTEAIGDHLAGRQSKYAFGSSIERTSGN
jgi:hypothetical protein